MGAEARGLINSEASLPSSDNNRLACQGETSRSEKRWSIGHSERLDAIQQQPNSKPWPLSAEQYFILHLGVEKRTYLRTIDNLIRRYEGTCKHKGVSPSRRGAPGCVFVVSLAQLSNPSGCVSARISPFRQPHCAKSSGEDSPCEAELGGRSRHSVVESPEDERSRYPRPRRLQSLFIYAGEGEGGMAWHGIAWHGMA